MNKEKTVSEFIATLDEQTAKDTQTLVGIMKKISIHKPIIYSGRTIGFDTYHYKYETGREGDSFVLGFYPRKGKVTIYLMDGTKRYIELLEKLDKHTTTGYCIYIKQLSDINLEVLEQILFESYKYIKSLGVVNKILWQ